MQIPPRLQRTYVENRLGRPPLTEKQREREERIIGAAQILMEISPCDPVTMGEVADSVRMTTATIRRYFIDIETILAHILHRHLMGIFRAISKIPREDPNRAALQRAAYLEATRHPWGGFTGTHDLLLQKRRSLPEDLAKPIAEMHQLIGEALAGEHAETAFLLLDAPNLKPHEIEAMLATYATASTAPGAPVGWASAHQLHATPTPTDEPPAEPPASDGNAAPEPKPAQPEPSAQPRQKHYKDWKAAKRQKSLQAQAARAARAGPQAPPRSVGPNEFAAPPLP
jgi:AcrR family transcriptional regulator